MIFSLIEKTFNLMLFYLTDLSLSPLLIVSHLTVALVLSIIVFLVYKLTYSGVVYSKSFNISLLLIILITTMIMMIIRSSVALSLGMVGALSIVRFRTAIKEPKDIAYMFWAITIGLSVGAGAYVLAIIGSVLISIILLSFTYIFKKNENLSYLIVINGKDLDSKEISEVLKKYAKRSKIRTKNITDEMCEFMYEIYLKDSDDTEIISALKDTGADLVNLIAYNNDIGK